jgi:hypothetical protein
MPEVRPLGSPSLLPVVVASALTACSGGASSGGHDGLPVRLPRVTVPGGHPARIEVRDLDARPRLTLVSRDGDPTPAIVAVVVTDLGPAPTTLLAAVVESRLRAAGFAVDTHVDRSAFRVRLLVPDPAQASPFFNALAAAFSRPITPGSPELSLAAQRLASLKRNPLDAVELLPIADCTGALGIASNEPLPDPASPAGARDAEAHRASVLTVGRTSIAAVGPAAFGQAVTRALEQSQSFASGAAATDPWPAADAVSAYVAVPSDAGRGAAAAVPSNVGRGAAVRTARVTIAVRVADPFAAAATAERLGAPDSPLIARLRALPEPFRVVEVIGVARPRGGCVSVAIETATSSPGGPLELTAAFAGALAREEITAELSGPSGPAVAARQILTATDPREAASRAAWWTLAAAAPGAPERWAFALGLPAPAGAGSPRAAPSGNEAPRQRFAAELERATAGRAAPIAELRAAVERGQGELWVLLASPCGVAEEGTDDAGHSAVATLAALEARRGESGVTLEPWITADGIGVIARAAFQDERETPAELARRVADAAARSLTATLPSGDSVSAARSTALDLLERTDGREGAAFSVFAGAIAPDHPSWIEPFGVFTKVAASGLSGIRLRRRAIADGPLRVAVLANADAAQAQATASAVDRWLRPSPGPRACRGGAPRPARPGRYEARLPGDAPLAQALIGAPIPAPGAPGRALAELTALALGGDGGLLARALRETAATASARILGGARAPALVLDIRAPEGALASAVADVKLLLARLPREVTDADLARAFAAAEQKEQASRGGPRRRLFDLWAGRKPGPLVKPPLAAFQAFLGDALKDPALVVVEARPE